MFKILANASNNSNRRLKGYKSYNCNFMKEQDNKQRIILLLIYFHANYTLDMKIFLLAFTSLSILSLHMLQLNILLDPKLWFIL